MWFKNLHVYALNSDAVIDLHNLGEQMAACRATPLGSTDARRTGWTAPAGRHGKGQLIHEVNGHRLMTALRQERILPAAVIKEEVDDRIAAIQAEEGRMVTRKEKTALKEQVVEELLPRAFVRKKRVDVWWDTHARVIGVNASSRSDAEDALDLLRETIGSLKVTPWTVDTLSTRTMTTWLGDPATRPADMLIGDGVELVSRGDDGVVRARQVDLDSDDMQQLLESGRSVSKMALSIEGQLSFVLHDDMSVKSLRFGDAYIEEADQADDGDDVVSRLETDFILMAGCLNASIRRVTEWFQGD